MDPRNTPAWYVIKTSLIAISSDDRDFLARHKQRPSLQTISILADLRYNSIVIPAGRVRACSLPQEDEAGADDFEWVLGTNRPENDFFPDYRFPSSNISSLSSEQVQFRGCYTILGRTRPTLYRLQRHALPIKAHFRASLVLAYAVPAPVLRPLLPAGLTLDTYGNFGFLAIALVETRDLRPSFIPAPLGMSFFLSGYRIFTRYQTTAGGHCGVYEYSEATQTACQCSCLEISSPTTITSVPNSECNRLGRNTKSR
jgi:hypothetical protein